jgi:hypothetical protein
VAATTTPEEVSTFGASTLLYGPTALGSFVGIGVGALAAAFSYGASLYLAVYPLLVAGPALGAAGGAALGALAFDGANVGQTALVTGATGLATTLVSTGVGMLALGDSGNNSGIFGGVTGGAVAAPIAAVIVAHATDAHP